MTPSRRNFIKTTSATLAGAVIAPQLLNASSFSSANPEPICAFSKCLQFLDYDRLGETLALAGYEGADLTVRSGGHVLPENVRADLPRAVKALQKSGISVPMMVTKIVDPEDPATEQILGSASELGIKYYRLGYMLYDRGKTIQENLDGHKRSIEKLGEINRKYGILGCYHNHPGDRVGSPLWDLHWLLKDSSPDHMGVQYDICQAVMEGSESWPLALKLLSPWIKTTALKDFEWMKEDGKWQKELVPLGRGMVDYNAYFESYKAYHISGPITVHYEYDLGGAENGSNNPTMSLDEILVYLQNDLSWLKNKLNEQGIL